MKYLLSLLVFAFPVMAFAALDGIQNIVGAISGIINTLVPVIISLAFLYFVWGIIKYVLAKDPEKQKEAKGTIVWGVIAMTVIVGVWGISYFLLAQIGVDTDVSNIVVPRITR